MATSNGAGAAVRTRAQQKAAPPRPRLQLVRQVGGLRPGLVGTVVISLVFSTLFVLAVLQAVLVQGQLKLDQLDREIRQRETERSRREVEVATAESPDRIQAEAVNHGLVTPPDVVFLERATVDPIAAPTRNVTLQLDSAERPAPSAPSAPETPPNAAVTNAPVAGR